MECQDFLEWQLKWNITVVLVPSKSISVTNRAFGIAFVGSFYFIKLSSKPMVTFATNIFLTAIIIFFITPKRMRKAMGTENSKIFKSNFYFLYLC